MMHASKDSETLSLRVMGSFSGRRKNTDYWIAYFHFETFCRRKILSLLELGMLHDGCELVDTADVFNFSPFSVGPACGKSPVVSHLGPLDHRLFLDIHLGIISLEARSAPGYLRNTIRNKCLPAKIFSCQPAQYECRIRPSKKRVPDKASWSSGSE